MSQSLESLSRSPLAVSLVARRVARVTLRVGVGPLNLLTLAHSEAVEAVAAGLARRRELAGVVLTAGSAEAFSAGADLRQLLGLRTPNDGVDLARRAQQAIEVFASLEVPVVAAIHGPCLGLALSWALVADQRVISDHPTTCLGFPEIGLDLIPVGGAAWRLPALLGMEVALDLLLSGRAISAAAAVELGLAEAAVAPALVERTAVDRVLALAQQRQRWSARGALRAGLQSLERRITRNRVTQAWALREARAAVARRGGDGPAVQRLLAVARGFAQAPPAGWEAERRLFGELAAEPGTQHRIRLWLETRGLMGRAPAAAASLHSVGVVGTTGEAIDLLATTAAGGLGGRLIGEKAAAIPGALRSVRDRLASVWPGAGEADLDAALSRITATPQVSGVGGVPIVIDATLGPIEQRRRILHEVETHGRPDIVYAALTATLDPADLAARAARPERVLALAAWAPVSGASVLEVIAPEHVAPDPIATLAELVRGWNKIPLVVQNRPGGYVCRVGGVLLGEALRLVAEGVAPHLVDEVLTSWGFSLGPLAAMDDRGWEPSIELLASLGRAFEGRLALSPQVGSWLRARRERRFYRLDVGGRRVPVDRSLGAVLGLERRVDRRALVERCVLGLVAEVVRCFGEGVIASARDANVGAVHGVGFPVTYGGPLRYVDEVGVTDTARRLERLARDYGPRFRPPTLLLQMAHSGASFHGAARVHAGSEREGRAS